MSPTPAKSVTVHTDGACAGNPGPGGWAALLRYGGHSKEISGAEPATTNNRMELRAAIEALRHLRKSCQVSIHTDSQYLRDGITKWVHAWKRRKWQTKEKQPVKNQDLWMELDALSTRHQVTWHWLKGHAGHTGNERCDQLAREAISALKKTHSPAELKRLLAAFTKEAFTKEAFTAPRAPGPSQAAMQL